MTSPPHIVSKVFLSKDAALKDVAALRQEIFTSIETSLRALKLESVDLLLIHNTTMEHLRRREVQSCLEEARQQGKIRFFEGDSATAKTSPWQCSGGRAFRALSVPFNLLDQKMNARVFPTTVGAEVGLVPSAYLRGVLTSQVHSIPERFGPPKTRALEALSLLGAEVKGLAEAALRFCLSINANLVLVIGVRTIAGLSSQSGRSRGRGASAEVNAAAAAAVLRVNPIVDTRSWQDLI